MAQLVQGGHGQEGDQAGVENARHHAGIVGEVRVILDEAAQARVGAE